MQSMEDPPSKSEMAWTEYHLAIEAMKDIKPTEALGLDALSAMPPGKGESVDYAGQLNAMSRKAIRLMRMRYQRMATYVNTVEVAEACITELEARKSEMNEEEDRLARTSIGLWRDVARLFSAREPEIPDPTIKSIKVELGPVELTEFTEWLTSRKRHHARAKAKAKKEQRSDKKEKKHKKEKKDKKRTHSNPEMTSPSSNSTTAEHGG